MPKSEAELEQERLDAEAAAGEGESGDDGAPAGDPPVEIPKTGDEEVDKRVKQAVDSIVNDTVTKAVERALAAQREQAAKEAAAKAAKEQGDYKSLFEQSEREKHVLELNQWRGQALVAAGLDNKWFDAVQGNTLEEMTDFAKKFKKNLDAELKTRGEQIIEESPGTPRGGGKGTRQRNDKALTGEQKTDRTLRSAFGTRNLQHIQ